MKTLSLNKNYFILVLMGLSIMGYLMVNLIPRQNIQDSWTECNDAENIASPIVLGTSIPLMSDQVYHAQMGAIVPFGGTADPIEHIKGNQASEYTTWLPISYMRKDFDNNLKSLLYVATTAKRERRCEGYIVVKEVNPSDNNILDMSLYYSSNLILVEGEVIDCTVIPVSPETTIEELKAMLTQNF